MKVFTMVRIVCWVLTLLFTPATLLRSADFSLSLSSSPTNAFVGGTVLYTIGMTNVSGRALASVFLTNTLPSSVTLVSYTNSLGAVTRSGQTLTVFIVALADGGVESLILNVTPTAAGLLSNRVDVVATTATQVTTNILSRAYSARSDIGMTIIPSRLTALPFEPFTYTVGITNYGPDAAPNVQLGTPIPTNALFISSIPESTNIASLNTQSLSVGTLASGAGTQVQFTLQPTTPGTMVVAGFGFSVPALDTNSVNDIALTNITVIASLPGVLSAAFISLQTSNRQTGLMEQKVRLTNVGGTSIAATRLVVSNLTARLYNASGTNQGNPYVFYGGTLDPGGTVDLVLEYFVPSRVPIANPVLIAYEVFSIDLTAPVSSPPNIALVSGLPSGRVLIEFAAVPGTRYTIVYSDDSSFTNAYAAQPIVTAPANRVQWIDDGPPKTLSPPISVASRFYRVVVTP